MRINIKYCIFPFILIATSCLERNSDVVSTPVEWEFRVMKAEGGTASYKDTVATYRANLFSGSRLVSDGTYSGYYNDKGWLYPCKTDEEGNALNKYTGEIIPWNDPDWFSKTETDSQYSLRAPSNTSYSMLITSPAVKMTPYQKTVNGTSQTLYGIKISRESDWAVTDEIKTSAGGSYLEGAYIYDVSLNGKTRTMKERRAKINVKVACGAVSSVRIHSVYFKNVMTSAIYNPFTHEFEGDIILDGGETDPLKHFTGNSFPNNDGEKTGVGDKLIVPEGEELIIKKKDGIGDIPSDWWSIFDEGDEWQKGNDDKHVVTAIRDFFILPLAYSRKLNASYYYEDIMPEVIIRLGEEGKVMASIPIAADMEPMTEYTVFIYVSSTFVSASLTVIDWNTHRHWTENDGEDCDNLEVTFGKAAILEGEISITDWGKDIEIETTVPY